MKYAAAMATVWLLMSPALCRAEPAGAGDGDEAGAIQMLADVTLIDAECRDRNVVFGLVFSFVEAQTVRVADLMPGGQRRGEFDAAYARRAQDLSHDELCGSVAEHYARLIPGLFVARE